MTRIILITLLIVVSLTTFGASYQPVFSTAGFYPLANTGREVFNMNAAWRFVKGGAENAWKTDFDDSAWEVVQLPHGLENLPTEASGCVNYQGEAWYRKHFSPDSRLNGRKLFLHFEAIMGKSKVWVNGKLMTEHFGGYLPVIVDISNEINWGKDNIITVWTDNSNDPAYPPGKPQEVLDFSYFGGIYRDCWLVSHDQVHITDPNFENVVAGGGLFVAYDRVSSAQSDITLKLHVRNEKKQSFGGKVEYELIDTAGVKKAFFSQRLNILPDSAISVDGLMRLKNPELWSPESPYLYTLNVRIKDGKGRVVDGYRRRIGIRSIEFKGKDGFWLNGHPYEKPLIGANRHQDFAIVGNALSNSLHWRDAKKLRDAGLKVIRNAHYPQDPAFMDACDELGLFVIVNTPGWQFWNDKPIFAQRVFSDIRNMVRRDRNHPSVWMWEPILNETWYPADFAKKTRTTVDEEYPYPYCYCGCDATARGKEHFRILFTHPTLGDAEDALQSMVDSITYFTREWGDNVDDWSSHNSPSRVSRAWGEVPMQVQAKHYASPDYQYTCYETLFQTSRQHVGGCLWHSFDHQRGYHPDPFYGGLMDVFRQPKYSYYMFMAQRDPRKSNIIAETGPMIYIAHEMTPFSPRDVTVYSNCDEVRLTVFKDGKQYAYKKPVREKGMPSPVIRFENVYDFMEDKGLSRRGKRAEVYMLAEGLIDGKVVVTEKRIPARRPSKIVLWLDNNGVDLVADGSDLVTVVAGVADADGNIKHLNNYHIRFSIEGEGGIVGDESVLANPRPVVWGTAPILVRSTLNSGKIKIRAEVLEKGSQMPAAGVIEFESVKPGLPLVYNAGEAAATGQKAAISKGGENNRELENKIDRLQKELNTLKLKEVEKQQEEFEGKK